MYKIVGADGNEYGPVDAAQIRQWITEGRVNAQTKVKAEDCTDWRPLSEFAELVELLTARDIVPPTTPAVKKVSGPAIGLIVTPVLCLVANLYGLGLNVAGPRGEPIRELDLAL